MGRAPLLAIAALLAMVSGGAAQPVRSVGVLLSGSADTLISREGNAAREQGLSRAEGKEYVVQDGDVMLFRFSS